MKTLALILIAFSLNAVADESSGFDTYALKCASANGSIGLEFNSGRGMEADDSKVTPLTLRIGNEKGAAEMYSYIDSRGTYVDNTETDQIHSVIELFGEGMTNAHVYDDRSQTYGAIGRTFTLAPSKKMTTLDQPSPLFAARFKMAVEIREGLRKRTVVLACKARMRSYGS